MAPAPKIVPADPQAWRQGFLNLRPSVVPCPGLTMQSWAGVHEKCVDFLDRWADEAAGLGWTILDLFGVHPEAGLIRPDFCGGIVMSGDKVSALTANRPERLIVPILVTGIAATVVWSGTIGAAGWWLAHGLLVRVGMA